MPPQLPVRTVNATRINIDVQVGPRGVQLIAFTGGGAFEAAKSGWSVDISMVWGALGVALTPGLIEVARGAARDGGR